MLRDEIARLKSSAWVDGRFSDVEKYARQTAFLDAWEQFQASDLSEGAAEFEQWLHDQCLGDFIL